MSRLDARRLNKRTREERIKESNKEDERPMLKVRGWNFYEGEEKALHSRGGRTPFILIQVVRITGQRTYSCAARPKLLGKVHKNRKKEEFEFSTEGQRKV